MDKAVEQKKLLMSVIYSLEHVYWRSDASLKRAAYRQHIFLSNVYPGAFDDFMKRPLENP